MKSTFKVLFYLKKGSEKRNGEVTIMARVTVDGKICQFSTKLDKPVEIDPICPIQNDQLCRAKDTPARQSKLTPFAD